MDTRALLSVLGLHEYEIKIYLTLLESVPLTVSDLSRKTGLHRPLIYRALPGLKQKELITLSPRGKQMRYAATSPQRLKDLFAKLHLSLNHALPELQSKFETKEKRPLISFHEGSKGITAVFEDLLRTLKSGDVFYRYSSGKDLKKNERYLPKNYRIVRDQKRLERFVITNESTNEQKQKRLERQIKILPKNLGDFSYDITQLVYGNKIAFIDYTSETALIIENPLIAQFQSHLFKALYHLL